MNIPLHCVRNFDCCEVIAQKLMENNDLSYLLSVSDLKNLIDNFNEIIKHHMSVPIIIDNLAKNWGEIKHYHIF